MLDDPYKITHQPIFFKEYSPQISDFRRQLELEDFMKTRSLAYARDKFNASEVAPVYLIIMHPKSQWAGETTSCEVNPWILRPHAPSSCSDILSVLNN